MFVNLIMVNNKYTNYKLNNKLTGINRGVGTPGYMRILPTPFSYYRPPKLIVV